MNNKTTCLIYYCIEISEKENRDEERKNGAII
jgi:hypothetical protein